MHVEEWEVTAGKWMENCLSWNKVVEYDGM